MNLSPSSAVLPSDMSETTTKNCPFCAETVKPEAKICRHCRSTLTPAAIPDAYRNREGRQLAGVSVALAEAFGISVTFIRLAFIVLTFVNFAGPLIYVALWLLLPAEPQGLSPLGQLAVGKDGKTSIFQQGVDTISGFLESLIAWLKRTLTPAPAGPAGELPPVPPAPSSAAAASPEAGQEAGQEADPEVDPQVDNEASETNEPMEKPEHKNAEETN